MEDYLLELTEFTELMTLNWKLYLTELSIISELSIPLLRFDGSKRFKSIQCKTCNSPSNSNPILSKKY